MIGGRTKCEEILMSEVQLTDSYGLSWRKRKGPGAWPSRAFLGCRLIEAKQRCCAASELGFVLVDWARCGLIFREAAGGWPDRLLEFAERDIEGFLGGTDEVDLHAFEHFGLQVLLHVGLILRRENHLANSRTLRAQHFFFHAADRQHDSGERNLTGHRDARSDRSPCQQADESGDHRDARGWTVFRNRTRRNVDVQVDLAG